MKLPQQRLRLICFQNGLQERIRLRLIACFGRGCRLTQPVCAAGREKPQQLLPGVGAEQTAELLLRDGRLARR